MAGQHRDLAPGPLTGSPIGTLSSVPLGNSMLRVSSSGSPNVSLSYCIEDLHEIEKNCVCEDVMK